MTSVVRSPLAQPFLEQLILKPNESFELPDANLDIFQRLKRAVQYDSEQDFISCLAEVNSTVDLVMLALICVRLDWREALKTIVSKAAFKKDLPVTYAHPLYIYICDILYEGSILLVHMRTFEFVSLAVTEAMQYNRFECFKILFCSSMNDYEFHKPLFHLEDMYRIISAEDTEDQTTESFDLQNKWIRVLINFCYRNDDIDSFFLIVAQQIGRKNKEIVDHVVETVSYLEFLSEEDYPCQALAGQASIAGFKEQAIRFFSYQKDKTIALPYLNALKMAIKAKHLELVEMMLVFYGKLDCKNFAICTSNLYELMKENHKLDFLEEHVPGLVAHCERDGPDSTQ